MNISAIETPNSPLSPQAKSEAEIRQVATQFESILLQQLTSAMSGTSEGDEDNLFGGDSGTGLAKQMFAEQLANTMAQSGGVGLADLIVSQVQANQPKTFSGKNNKLDNAMAAVKDIKDLKGKSFDLNESKSRSFNLNAASEPLRVFPRGRDSAISSKTPLVNKSAKFVPVANEAEISNSPDGIEIISTFADEVAKYGNADLPKPVMGDEKLFRYTRSRVVPNYALGESAPMSVNNVTTVPNKLMAVSYQSPVGGRISSGFGNRMHPVDHKVKFHAGIDIAAPTGTPIATAAEGKVSFAGWKGGYGNLVIVEHPDGRETRYGHADKILVQKGEQVSPKQIIATVGSTGKSTGPHLHFEVRENGKPVNPLKFLP